MTALTRSTSLKLMMICIAAGIVASCTTLIQGTDDPVKRKTSLSAEYIDTRALFDQGLYKTALEQFIMLSQMNVTKETLYNARLGEICCRLILATTPAQYYSALGMWNKFTRSIMGNQAFLEYDMLDPVIVHLTTQQAMDNMDSYPSNGITEEKKAELGKANAEEQAIQKKISTLEKEVKQSKELKQQIKEMESENRSLKEKIKALETIDQNIEKKKTEISSPSD
jgi:hypothetical protein